MAVSEKTLKADRQYWSTPTTWRRTVWLADGRAIDHDPVSWVYREPDRIGEQEVISLELRNGQMVTVRRKGV